MPRRMRKGAWGTSTWWAGATRISGARTFPYTYHGPAQPADKFFEELADQVKARGVREVTGTLIADDSYFVWEPFAPNWAADDLEWGYGAPVTALAFNDNLLTLHVKPAAKAGDAASVCA